MVRSHRVASKTWRIYLEESNMSRDKILEKLQKIKEAIEKMTPEELEEHMKDQDSETAEQYAEVEKMIMEEFE